MTIPTDNNAYKAYQATDQLRIENAALRAENDRLRNAIAPAQMRAEAYRIRMEAIQLVVAARDEEQLRAAIAKMKELL